MTLIYCFMVHKSCQPPQMSETLQKNIYILLGAWASLSVAMLDLSGSIYNIDGSIYKIARSYIEIHQYLYNILNTNLKSYHTIPPIIRQ